MAIRGDDALFGPPVRSEHRPRDLLDGNDAYQCWQLSTQIVYVRREALLEMMATGRRYAGGRSRRGDTVEVAFLCMGRRSTDARGTYSIIESFPFVAEGKLSTVRLPGPAKDRIRRQSPALDSIGWAHTHPDFGVFFSEPDVATCGDFGPDGVNFVYDPIRHEIGVARGDHIEITESTRRFGPLPVGPAAPSTQPASAPDVVHSEHDLAPPPPRPRSAAPRTGDTALRVGTRDHGVDELDDLDVGDRRSVRGHAPDRGRAIPAPSGGRGILALGLLVAFALGALVAYVVHDADEIRDDRRGGDHGATIVASGVTIECRGCIVAASPPTATPPTGGADTAPEAPMDAAIEALVDAAIDASVASRPDAPASAGFRGAAEQTRATPAKDAGADAGESTDGGVDAGQDGRATNASAIGEDAASAAVR